MKLNIIRFGGPLLASCLGSNDANENVNPPKSPSRKFKAAIIGAGIGGSSCAYFLRQECVKRQLHLDLDVFEADLIGGRARTIEFGDRAYEAGGSVLHPKNRYMAQFVDQFGLHRILAKDMSEGRMGLYDGKEFVFEETEWSIWNSLKMLWRYGYDLVRYKLLVRDMLNHFGKIYDLQSAGQSYGTARDLVTAIAPEFGDLCSTPLRSYLKKRGIGDQFINELAQAVMLVNYGQTVDSLHAFVGGVSLAGAADTLWAVKEGNCKVAEKLIESADVTVHKQLISEVKRVDDGFVVRGSDGQSRKYDVVIVACPLNKLAQKKLTFTNMHIPSVHYQPYHHLITYFVDGHPNAEFWHKTASDLPESILPTNKMFYNSFSTWSDTQGRQDTGIWKIFADSELNDEQLKRLFIDVKQIKSKEWFAYPEYSNISFASGADSFILHESGLFYVNAIELTASAMEMSAIGGRNAALLAVKHLNQL